MNNFLFVIRLVEFILIERLVLISRNWKTNARKIYEILFPNFQMSSAVDRDRKRKRERGESGQEKERKDETDRKQLRRSWFLASRWLASSTRRMLCLLCIYVHSSWRVCIVQTILGRKQNRNRFSKKYVQRRNNKRFWKIFQFSLKIGIKKKFCEKRRDNYPK